MLKSISQWFQQTLLFNSKTTHAILVSFAPSYVLVAVCLNMADGDAHTIYPFRLHLDQETRTQAARERCCSNMKFRLTALLIFVFGVVVIALAEIYDVDPFVYIGSFILFIGFFMAVLDCALYLQAKSDRRQGRRLRQRAGAQEQPGNIW